MMGLFPLIYIIQRLYSNGKMLVDGLKLEDCGLRTDCNILLLLILLGGKGGFGSNLRASGKQS